MSLLGDFGRFEGAPLEGKTLLGRLGNAAWKLNQDPNWQMVQARQRGENPFTAHQVQLQQKKTENEETRLKAQAEARKLYEEKLASGQSPTAMEAFNAGIPAQVHKQNVPSTSDQPSNVREWEYYNSLPPEDQQRFLAMKRAQQIKDFGGYHGAINPDNTVTNIGDKTLPPDKELDYIGDAKMAQVLGQKQGESIANKPQSEAKVDQLTRGADNVISTVDDVLSEVDMLSAGIPGKVISTIPGTDAYDMRQKILTIKSNLGFDKLQAMRDASPTGGALGQVSERELAGLEATVASLEVGQSPEQLRENLQKIKNHYEAWKQTVAGQYNAAYGDDDGWGIVE